MCFSLNDYFPIDIILSAIFLSSFGNVSIMNFSNNINPTVNISPIIILGKYLIIFLYL